MRYMQLSEMLSDLRLEARLSPNVAHGVQLAQAHMQLLRRIQEDLWLTYDWPHLKTTQTQPVTAGQRYATYPDRFTFEGIVGVSAKDLADEWSPLVYGIGPDELNFKDSDADEQDYPVRKWQNYLASAGETINSNMFEVWPIPNADTTLRFHGKRALFPLTEAAHVSTIDGPLIVLHAAVEILAAQKSEDAQVKLQKAQDRLRFLKMRQTNGSNRPINLAGKPNRSRPRPGIDYIP